MRHLRAATLLFSPLMLIVFSAGANLQAQSNPKSAPPVTVSSVTPAQEKFFETSIRPLLAEKCYSCHSATEQRGGLRLDSREAMLKGNAHGPVLAPGDIEKSVI